MKEAHNTRNKANIFLLIIIIIIAAFQVAILNFDSTAGETISSLSGQIAEIEGENIRLAQKIASASSIAAISVKAEKYGLINKQTTLSLASPIPMAFSKLAL